MDDASDLSVDGVDVEGMRAALADTPVTFAILFGSRVRGASDDRSDVDVTLQFPAEMTALERFRSRNRIDADLQSYADAFVDVSDVESLPVPVAYAALRDGIILVGDEEAVSGALDAVKTAYEATETDRRRANEEFIDRLARGET